MKEQRSARPNKLINEPSSYLRQHAYDPVDWYPWGEAAFTKARRENKPIFLSIGYATCHWCHVMAAESFADPDTAKLLNKHFVAVKVDRQEFPQVDEAYMRAAVQILGYGGWPLSLFCTPEGLPFFAGTYFPPEPRHGFPAFRQVLTTIAALWEEKGPKLMADSERLSALFADPPVSPEKLPWEELEAEALAGLAREFDPTFGGFGSAPKFPMPTRLRFLLRQAASGKEHARQMLVVTLDAMAQGGLRDPLFGGFHRYSTDASWFVPHYEKLLPDNALLVQLYFATAVRLGVARFVSVAEDCLRFLQNLARPSGSTTREKATAPYAMFAAGWDADARGEEGKTFTFTLQELGEVLATQEVELLTTLSPFPWRPGQARPLALRPLDGAAARRLGRPLPELRRQLAATLRKLTRAAQEKGLPHVDELPVTAWVAMACAAFAQAHIWQGLRKRSQAPGSRTPGIYLRKAELVGETLWQRGWASCGRMPRTLPKEGQGAPETLEDVAWAATAFLDLFAASGSVRWLSRAQELLADALPRYIGASGELFTTPADQPVFVFRQRSVFDGAQPAWGAVACEALLRTWLLTGKDRFRSWAEQALACEANTIRKSPANACSWLDAAELLWEPSLLLIAGDPRWPSTQALLRRAYLHPQAPQVVVFLDHWPPSEESLEALEVLRGKTAGDGEQAQAYLCRGFQCWPPCSQPDQLDALLAGNFR
ncbi:MAG: thioredoxin domain-containing protein [Thermoanaerobaculaceae bacterium]